MFTPPSFPLNCDNCSAPSPAESLHYIESTGDNLCAACFEDYMNDKAERQQQARDEEFYGG